VNVPKEVPVTGKGGLAACLFASTGEWSRRSFKRKFFDLIVIEERGDRREMKLFRPDPLRGAGASLFLRHRSGRHRTSRLCRVFPVRKDLSRLAPGKKVDTKPRHRGIAGHGEPAAPDFASHSVHCDEEEEREREESVTGASIRIHFRQELKSHRAALLDGFSPLF
jgi:hypothetical protein